jgi:hypothetical protein
MTQERAVLEGTNEVCHGDWNYSWFSGQGGLADEQGRMK